MYLTIVILYDRDLSSQPVNITNGIGMILFRFGEIESPREYSFLCPSFSLRTPRRRPFV